MTSGQSEEGAAESGEQFAAGNALMQTGRFAKAAMAYRRSLALNPAAPLAHNNLAVALAEQHLLGSAIAHYREAIRLDPEHSHAHFNLGNAYRELRRHMEAIACYERALELVPSWPAALLNLGLAFAAQGKQALAEASYREALVQQPDYPQAHNNLGLALEIQGHLDDAMKHFDRALELAPNFANAHSNRAQLRLLLGDFRLGWPEYEWRWHLPGVGLPTVDVPVLDNAALAGRTLLLRAEQGFGDTIQFVRFASLLKRAGAKIVVECQPALATLLARAHGVDHAVARGTPLPRCDAQIPLASLPGALGMLEVPSIPAAVPYVQPDPALVAQWRDRLACKGTLNVGIAWKGSPGHPQDCHRSIPSEHFAALAAVPGVALVSLQVEGRAPDDVPVIDLPPQATGSFEDTAAIVSNLDLVVTCDTALAHLSGALGVPVWIALPLVPDWRWLLDREDSPWYPSARLFRQTRLDDWGDVFSRIAAALVQLVANRQR